MLELNVSQAGVARVAVAGRSSLRMKEISSLLTRLPSAWLLATAVNTSAVASVAPQVETLSSTKSWLLFRAISPTGEGQRSPP